MKKLTKNILAALMASSCMCSAAAMSVNAAMPSVDSTSKINDLLSAYEEFDDHGWFSYETDSDYKVYYDKCTDDVPNDFAYFRGEGITNFYVAQTLNDRQFQVVLPKTADQTAVESVFRTFDSSCNIDVYNGNPDISVYDIIMSEDNANILNNAREIRKELEKIGDVTKFTYYGDQTSVSTSYLTWGESITTYNSRFCDIENLEEVLTDYVKDNNLDFTVEILDVSGLDSELQEYLKDTAIYDLVPNKEISMSDRFAVAMQIREDLGLTPDLVSFESSGDSYSDEVDVLNSVDGDANEDGKVNMSDATAVIQAIGNADKYGLTSQGVFNADTDCDGLTTVDAVNIQMKVAEAGTPE